MEYQESKLREIIDQAGEAMQRVFKKFDAPEVFFDADDDWGVRAVGYSNRQRWKVFGYGHTPEEALEKFINDCDACVYTMKCDQETARKRRSAKKGGKS